SPTITP
ncbi:GGDEF family domain protein, partial [Vibrio parahaemolyticus V-223/04]